MKVDRYATDERVQRAAQFLKATHGPFKPDALARQAGAPYYSRPFVHKVNDTIPHRYVFVSVGNDEHAVEPGSIELGDLLFAYHPDRAPNTDDLPDQLKIRSYAQRNDPFTTHAVSWQHLERWLAHHPNRYRDAHQLVREWQLIGVAHNDVAPFGGAREPSASRALNVVVGGRVGTGNLWGKEATAGKRLYLVVARDSENMWQLNPVVAYRTPTCKPDECVLKLGVVIESACEDPFLQSLRTTREKAEYVRNKRWPSQKVVFYLGA